jgi:RNA polymerase sigma-70 factor (ECF subfamily)
MTPERQERVSDEELLRRHATGDSGGFRALVERYSPELYRFLTRFLGQRAAVEDVVQETFLQVHISAATFDPTRRVKPWLFTIAANKARDLLRSRVRKREVSIENPVGWDEDAGSAVDFLPVESESPVDAIAESEESARVRAVVMELPQHLREVLLLSYFHRFPYKEMADILDIPIGTVKSRLHAAVGRFKQTYQAAYPSDANDAGDGDDSARHRVGGHGADDDISGAADAHGVDGP